MQTMHIYDVSMHRRPQGGQGLSEYALVLSLIAIVAIAALVILGREISSVLSTIAAMI